MSTELALASKLDILKETRELFANTHWTHGDLYTTDATGKKRFCMVGGLCHITAKNNLPEWLKQEEDYAAASTYHTARLSFYMNEIEDHRFLRDYDRERFVAGIDAEWELAKTIENNRGNWLAPDASPNEVENMIVNWNDSVAAEVFEERGDASYVLEVMDQTIQRVEEEDAASS